MTKLELLNSHEKLRRENARLKRKNTELKIENEFLSAELDVNKRHEGSFTGHEYEIYLYKLLNATVSDKSAGYDLLTYNNKKLEIKGSRLLKNDNTTKFSRWVWHRLLGDTGSKNYHRLILCGESDPRFNDCYIDPDSRFVFFDIPISVVMKLSCVQSLEKRKTLLLGSDPMSARTLERKLIWKYQVSQSTLISRYKKLE